MYLTMTKYIVLISMFFLFGCQTGQNDNSMKNETNTKDNPLTGKWNTPFGTPPFDKIKSEDYLPALEQGIKEHDKEINNIVNNSEAPTFKNTIVTFEKSGGLLKKVSMVFDAVESANTDDVLKETSKKIRPELASHYDKIKMNKKLFDRINSVYQQKDKLNLDFQDKKLLEETYKKFVRAGVNLPDDKKKRLQEINKRLASLSQQFGDNLLEETNDFDLWVTNKKDLGAMPANFVEAAAELAKKKGHDGGWSFTLQRPSIYPFLDYSPNRELRAKIFKGYTMRGNNNNEYDNKKVLEEMVNLRTERANLLGYKTHADYVLEESMAENPTNVYNLLDQVWKPALKTAKHDRNMLAVMMKMDGVDDKFQASDWRYYVKKIREKKYKFNEDETRPYFEVNAVRQGAFALANKLFGLTFKEMKNIPVWHKDQQVYEVLGKNGKHVGVLYMDFFARPSKKGGAWMNELRMQSNIDSFVSPIVTNNFNFPAPTGDSPSLLSFSQAQTVFHEFGHGLHGLLSNVKYGSLSGTNVPRDFVEFPSQVMENWMSEPEVLKLYAKHYKTGKVIPIEMIEKMNAANEFNEGFRSVEYLAASYLDMDWHTLKDTVHRNTLEFEKQSMEKIGLIEEIIPRYRSTYFAHIFSGGYSSGYYSYLWAEILDADAFAAFKETENVFDPVLAAKYKKMISLGGTKSGMELYKEFRGKEPAIDALLKRKGFVN
jgi:peptidyl-dipeptidase Dcp